MSRTATAIAVRLHPRRVDGLVVSGAEGRWERKCGKLREAFDYIRQLPIPGNAFVTVLDSAGGTLAAVEVKRDA